MNLFSLDQIFTPLPSNREYKRFQLPFIFSVIFPIVLLESYYFHHSERKRKKDRSYSQLDPFFSVEESQKCFEVYPKQFVECVSSSSSRSRDWGMNWDTEESMRYAINEITREFHHWSWQTQHKILANSTLSTRNKRRM